MLILALDTTLAACSAAVFDSNEERSLAQLHEPMQKGHAERLAGMTQEVVTNADVSFGQLDRIAVTTGPGTFTGVRIGLAMARGVGRALDVPVVGVSTLQAIAANVDDNRDALPVCVIVDARRCAVYTQTFAGQHQPVSEPECVHLADLASHLTDKEQIIIGSGVDLVTDRPRDWRLSRASVLPDANVVARLSADLPADGPLPTPLYLRPADAKPQTALIRLARQAIKGIPADAAYADVLAGIHGECFAEAWSAEDLAQMLAAPGTSATIALPDEDESEPAGFILVRQTADEAEIITMCVRPNMRRRGIAAQLLQPAINQLTSRGIAKIFLEVRTDNTAAIALYTAAGFTETGLRANYYALEDGSRADALIMARTI